MAPQSLVGAWQVSLCTVEALLLRSLSVQWRIFAGVVCVCSFCAPHAGIPEAGRVQFWVGLVAMARLDLVCASSSSPLTVRVHDGDNCCSHAPACCPLLGSDHFLCVGTTSFPRPEEPDAPRGIPLLRSHFKRWITILDGLYAEMLSILTAHAPGQRRSHRRRQVERRLFRSMCCSEWCPSGPPQGAF